MVENPAEKIELPPDCTLLPLTQGRLLVSRSHAVFCRVPPGEVAAVEQVLAGSATMGSLSESLRGELERHGFFGPPRPPEPAPPTVQLQLTNACNLSCSYCCTNSGSSRRREVTHAEMVDVVSRIPDLFGPGTRLALLGGEPLLLPWAVNLAEESLRQGLDLTLFTNGIPLADPALAKRVAGLCERGAEVRVSLAGPTRELCDGMSGGPRFDRVLAGLHALTEHGGQAIVDLMFVPDNVEAVAAHLPALRAQLPRGIRISFGVLYLSGREEGAHLFPSADALEHALDRVAFEAGETIPAPERKPLAFRREGCGCAMGNHLNVRSDGTFYTCFKMEECIGDLDTLGFEQAARHVQQTTHPASGLATCADCALNTLCGAGCRSDNFLYTADGDTPMCDTWRVRVLSELLAEDRVAAVDWPVHHLLAEARKRGIDAPEQLIPKRRSSNLLEP